MVFETEEASQVNGDVLKLTIPTAKSTKLEYVDEETNETLVVIDLITSQIQIEDFCKARGEDQTINWLKDFADWLSKEGGCEVTPSQAWFIVRDVQLKYEELKKKSNQSLTLLFGTESTPSVDPSIRSS